MADGHVAVEERIYGCAECGTDVHGGTAIVGNIPLFGERNYTYDFIVPEKVEIKSYRDSLDCRVSFPVAHHELQKGFGDNRQELVKLAKFISENLTIKGAELREVNIRGYASPEGNLIIIKFWLKDVHGVFPIMLPKNILNFKKQRFIK